MSGRERHCLSRALYPSRKEPRDVRLQHARAGRARAGVAGVRRGDRQAAVPLRAHPRPRRARCSTTSRPRRSTSCPSRSAGSPCRPRSATSGCGSSGRPAPTGTLPVILYMHGGGWVLGNAGTHDRLVRELAVGAGAAVVFVEYDRSPEARYPVAIEQGYATAQWITREGAAHGLDPERMAIAGDSVGGNMTAAITLMARDRGDVRFVHQSMYYPVTDARDGHRLLRAVRGGLLPHREGDGVVLGRLRARRRAARGAVRLTAARQRRAARRPPAGARDRRRGRRAARRGRGVRGAAARAPASRSRPSATTASRTTS